MFSMLARTMKFDQQAGLHSIPRYFGIDRALWIARLFHMFMLVLLLDWCRLLAWAS